jgi:hypothetical protein
MNGNSQQQAALDINIGGGSSSGYKKVTKN